LVSRVSVLAKCDYLCARLGSCIDQEMRNTCSKGKGKRVPTPFSFSFSADTFFRFFPRKSIPSSDWLPCECLSEPS
jgi:hypothetical protein